MLVQILVKTDVTRYVMFTGVDGSFVYQQGKVYKVPSNSAEAVKSSLLGFWEKGRCATFLEFVRDYEEGNPKTHKGSSCLFISVCCWIGCFLGLNLNKMTAKDVFKHFGLQPATMDFIGHAMALHNSDDYLDAPALDTVKKVRVCAQSVLRYGKSPYIYPLYGLVELPQGFARQESVFFVFHCEHDLISFQIVGSLGWN